MKAKLLLACALTAFILTPLQADKITIISSRTSQQYKLSHTAAWLCGKLRNRLTPLERENREAQQLEFWMNPHTKFESYKPQDLVSEELDLIIPILEKLGKYYRHALQRRDATQDIFCIDTETRLIYQDTICDHLADYILNKLKTGRATTTSLATLINAARKLGVPEVIMAAMQAKGSILISIRQEGNLLQYEVSRTAAWLCKTLREHFTPIQGENIEARQLALWRTPHTKFKSYQAPDLVSEELELILPTLESLSRHYGQDEYVDSFTKILIQGIAYERLAEELLNKLKAGEITTTSMATLIVAARKLGVPEIETAATWAAARYVGSTANVATRPSHSGKAPTPNPTCEFLRDTLV